MRNTVRATESHLATYRSWSLARYPAESDANHDIAELPVHEIALRLSLFALEVTSVNFAAVLVSLQVLASALLPHSKLLITGGGRRKHD